MRGEKRAKLEALETSPNFNLKVGIEMPFVRVALLKIVVQWLLYSRKKERKHSRQTINSLGGAAFCLQSRWAFGDSKSNLPNPDSGVNLIPELSIKIVVEICVSFNDFLQAGAGWSKPACSFLIYPKFFLSKVCMWLSIGVRVPIFSQPYANNMQEMQKLE